MYDLLRKLSAWGPVIRRRMLWRRAARKQRERVTYTAHIDRGQRLEADFTIRSKPGEHYIVDLARHDTPKKG